MLNYRLGASFTGSSGQWESQKEALIVKSRSEETELIMEY